MNDAIFLVFPEYQPLQKDEIRVLDLSPGLWDSPIVVSLKRVSLLEPVHFEVISYVWGDGNDVHPLIHKKCLSDSDESVKENVTATRNLRDALQHFRDPVATKTIWADALCIDQQSDGERSQQVRLMQEIYIKADRVLLWLGHEDDETAAAIGYLKDVVNFCTASRNISDFTKVNNLGELAQLLGVPHLPTFDAQGASATFKLFMRPWFYRIWVVQEVAAGQEAVVSIGHYTIPFAYLGLGASWLREVQFVATGTGAGSQGLRNASIMWQKRYVSQENPSSLLDDGRDLLATNPRDKVYGLLGFASLRKALIGYEPAYNKTVEEVYIEIALVIIENTRNLDVINFAESPPNIDDVLPSTNPKQLGWPGTPSWVARWDEATWFPTSAMCGLTPHKERTGPPAFVISSDSQAGILRLHGRRIDEVMYVAPYVQWPDEPGESPRPQNPQVFLAMWSAISKHLPDCAPEAILSAWAQTLTGGITSSYQPAQHFSREHSAGLVAFLMNALESRDMDEGLVEGLADFYRLLRKAKSVLPETDDIKFQMAMCLVLSFRRMFVTAGGKLGLGHSGVEEGDTVVWLHGGKMPFVLRKVNEHWGYVGEGCLYDVKKQRIQGWEDCSEEKTSVFSLQ